MFSEVKIEKIISKMSNFIMKASPSEKSFFTVNYSAQIFITTSPFERSLRLIDSDEPIIASRQCLNYDFKKWAGEKADKIRIAATGDIPFNLSLLAKENVGSFLCFDKIINTSEESPLCYIPLEPPMISPMYIIWKKNAEFTSPARKLMERFRFLVL